MPEIITKDMTIGEILDKDTKCAPIFFEAGMHCLGCPASSGESLEQACEVHGIDCDKILDRLNNYFSQK
jgi:hybrid cluster-associated redox disulfide protein